MSTDSGGAATREFAQMTAVTTYARNEQVKGSIPLGGSTPDQRLRVGRGAVKPTICHSFHIVLSGADVKVPEFIPTVERGPGGSPAGPLR